MLLSQRWKNVGIGSFWSCIAGVSGLASQRMANDEMSFWLATRPSCNNQFTSIICR